MGQFFMRFIKTRFDEGYVKSQMRIRPRALVGGAREADPHLGQNISARDAGSLLAASRSLNFKCPRSGSASGSLKQPRSGALPT